jgi:hypothetical protein
VRRDGRKSRRTCAVVDVARHWPYREQYSVTLLIQAKVDGKVSENAKLSLYLIN